MKKILKNSVITLAAVLVVGGGAYAWQLQRETVSGIAYAAGSMDLKIDSNKLPEVQDWSDGFSTDAFSKSGLEPGSKGEQIIDVKSEGDIAGKISIKMDVVTNNENTLLNPEVEAGDLGQAMNLIEGSTGDGELADNMKVIVSYDANNTGNFEKKYERTLNEYELDLDMLELGQITSPTGIASVKLEWFIPADVNNTIMTDSVGFDVIFGLE